jgi:hypothetical protein
MLEAVTAAGETSQGEISSGLNRVNEYANHEQLSPNTNILLPRIQRQGIADVTVANGMMQQKDEMGTITIRDQDIRSLNRSEEDEDITMGKSACVFL